MHTLNKSEYIAIKPCIKPGLTNIIHYWLFHGFIENENTIEPAGSYTSFVNCLESGPIKLSKSGVINPPIIMPGFSLIVNSEVKGILSKYNIQTRTVKLVKLVDCWYNAGDLSFYTSLDKNIKNPFADVEEEFLKSLADSEKFQKDSIEYHEVLAYKIVDLNKIESNDVLMHAYCRFKDFTYGSKKIDFDYKQSTLKLYPIIWDMAVIVPGFIFSDIMPFFDFNFFTAETIYL